MKALCPGQHWPHYKYMGEFFDSRASNSKPNSLISPKFELIQDFMPAPIICKFDEDSIKNGAIDRTFSPLFYGSFQLP